ncbi:cation:proton antiporter [Candidatus Latescibacterota bacterium]
MNALLYLAEAFLIAFIMKLVVSKLRIPSVSGYVLGGVILGGSLFFWIPGGRTFAEQWLFSEKVLTDFNVINEIALGLIALSIGVELEWKRIQSLGRSIFFIAVFEAVASFILVSSVTYILWKDVSQSLIFGAISSATAPAATVAVIQQYKAKGPLTRTILAVVGLDDAISFILFAFSLALVKSLMMGQNVDIIHGLVGPVIEIIVSLSIGAIIGLITVKLIIMTKDQDLLVFLLGGVILAVAGLAASFHVSELLANMACGIVIVNTYPVVRNKIRTGFNSFLPIFYALFFIMGGAHLNVNSLPAVWIIAVVYFTCRSIGKISGAFIGAYAGHAPPEVRSYVGLTLLPQVGAAVALALVVQSEFGSGAYGDGGIEFGRKIINVLLITTIITEFVGPYMTKYSLFRAGEARE